MEPEKLKIIVIGGGPVGLTAAYALHHANIPFTVLERRDTVVLDEGASLVLAPHSLRIMHQFGLLEKLLAIGGEIQCNKALTREGKVFRDTLSPRGIRKNHGTAPVAFHRAELIQLLYDNLPEGAKERYLTGKNVVGITSTMDGVSVTCADESVYTADIIIGADGVHSKTRRLMGELALSTPKPSPNSKLDWDEENPFIATYKCMWCSFPRPSEVGETYETHGKDRSIMYITGHDRGWIFAYEKLPVATRERVRYSKEDVEAFAASFAEYPVTESIKVKDVWEKKMTAGMANLEEGVARHWSLGRVVLVGDACKKFTPNAGLGLNGGIEDVVTLCNGLHRAMKSGGKLDTAGLGRVFGEYQRMRVKNVKEELKRSAHTTRMQAWANTVYFIGARYLMNPAMVQAFFIRTLVAGAIKKGQPLEYVAAEEPFQGRVKWVYPLRR